MTPVQPVVLIEELQVPAWIRVMSRLLLHSTVIVFGVKAIFYVFNNMLFTKEGRSKETTEIRQGYTALAKKPTKPLH